MKMKTIAVSLKVGTLLVHNQQLADPQNEYAKALKEITGKKKKNDDDAEEISRREFQGGLYFDEKLGPYVPDSWIYRMIVEGARKSKMGKEVGPFLEIAEFRIPIVYDGPRTREGLWKDKRFIDRRSVVISGRRVMRTRPRFDNCRLDFTVRIYEGGPGSDVILQALDHASVSIGIGSGRPGSPKGTAAPGIGKFSIEKFEVAK
jgi:hypothetical protein